ncbi:RfaG Glycosyltransferase [Candidatus Nanopelagicaceae bacterium]
MKSMRVCGISHADSLSARFNGLSIKSKLSEEGIEYSLLSDLHERVSGKSITPERLRRLSASIAEFEAKTGFQSRFYFWTVWILFNKHFRKAHVVHYHILHNNFFRLEALKLLTRIKPSVWTLHDLWITTGHCIQPLDCNRYGHGCGQCPALGRTIAVQRDRTEHEYARKVRLIKKLNCDYIVSTQWMRTRVLANLPIDSDRLHLIPFGIDSLLFTPFSVKESHLIREKYQISDNAFTVFMNAHNDVIKGIEIVKKIVSSEVDLKNVLFILIDAGGLFASNQNVISLPRATTGEEMREYFGISNLVIVPSLGESFSLITLEAMSCGKPVVTLKESAAHEVTDSEEFFTFSEANVVEKISQIIRISSSEQYLLEEEGSRNRARVLENFELDKHSKSVSALYQSLIEKRKGRLRPFLSAISRTR